MSTAEELLCSRKWRLRHSLWMLAGWVPFAVTAWIGYLIIGVTSRNWRWIALSGGFFAFGIAWFAWAGTFPPVEKGESLPPEFAVSNAIWGWSAIVLWIGNAAALQLLINRRWLVWRAHHAARGGATPWYATATATPGGAPTPPEQDARSVAAAFDAALAAPAASAPVLAPPSTPPIARAMVDLNTAPAEELAALPGLDGATAARIVEVRRQSGGFGSPSELVTRAGVAPHVVVGLQELVSASAVSAPAPTPTSASSTAAESGRRLEF